jgi:transcriptional regulator with XRE-family HTH domain
MRGFFQFMQSSTINESEIGKKIKAVRLSKGITLETLATQTGFTKSYLAKLEKSEKAPPVSTLGIIARALDLTISYLLGEEIHSTSVCHIKKGERTPVTRNGTEFGYSYEVIAHKFANKIMEPFILTLPFKPKKQTMFQHEGQEILFVLEGNVKFHHGPEEFTAEEGDCIYFDSAIPHFGEAVGPKGAKCLMVIPGNRFFGIQV